MNANTLKGQWNQVKGKVKQKWGKISDDEIQKVNGQMDELVGLIQKHYGYSKQEAEQQIKSFST